MTKLVSLKLYPYCSGEQYNRCRERKERKEGWNLQFYSGGSFFQREVLKLLIKKMNFDFEFSLQFQQLNIK